MRMTHMGNERGSTGWMIVMVILLAGVVLLQSDKLIKRLYRMSNLPVGRYQITNVQKNSFGVLDTQLGIAYVMGPGGKRSGEMDVLLVNINEDNFEVAISNVKVRDLRK